MNISRDSFEFGSPASLNGSEYIFLEVSLYIMNILLKLARFFAPRIARLDSEVQCSNVTHC
jgi:hypothetical protein